MTYNVTALFVEIEKAVTANPRMSLHDLARRFRVDRKTVEKIVRIMNAQTFRQYRQGILLRKAIDALLNDPLMSIKEIGLSLGYARPGDFSRFVKHATGKTPSDIRDIQRTSSDLQTVRVRRGSGCKKSSYDGQ